MFLQFERGNNFMHVASLAIYDPSTAPDAGCASRTCCALRVAPRAVPAVPPAAGQRAAGPRPSLLDRGSVFDVEFHVRHIALRTRATGDSCASRWRGCTRGRSTAASRCGRPTSSRGCTTCPARPGQLRRVLQDAPLHRGRRVGDRAPQGAALAVARAAQPRRRGAWHHLRHAARAAPAGALLLALVHNLERLPRSPGYRSTRRGGSPAWARGRSAPWRRSARSCCRSCARWSRAT